MHPQSYIYIMTNPGRTVLYTGVTNNVDRRAAEHRTGLGGRFTSMYHVTKLVYYEVFDSIVDAIAREKQIKAGSRAKKLALIEKMNPQWNDLATRLAPDPGGMRPWEK